MVAPTKYCMICYTKVILSHRLSPTPEGLPYKVTSSACSFMIHTVSININVAGKDLFKKGVDNPRREKKEGGMGREKGERGLETGQVHSFRPKYFQYINSVYVNVEQNVRKEGKKLWGKN